MNGGPAPTVELAQLGYKIGIYPAVCIGPVLHGIRKALKALSEKGLGWNLSEPAGPHELFAAVGLKEWNLLEQKYTTEKKD